MKKILFFVLIMTMAAGSIYCDELSDITGVTLNMQALAGAESAGIIGNISMAGLMWGLIFSSIGVFAFLYGKKKSNAPFMVIGILLTVYPYVVQDTIMIVVVGAALSAALYFFRR